MCCMYTHLVCAHKILYYMKHTCIDFSAFSRRYRSSIPSSSSSICSQIRELQVHQDGRKHNVPEESDQPRCIGTCAHKADHKSSLTSRDGAGQRTRATGLYKRARHLRGHTNLSLCLRPFDHAHRVNVHAPLSPKRRNG